MSYTNGLDNPELFFQTKLYTGNGSSTQAITLDGSENMQVDWCWIKNRDASEAHALFDSVRGADNWLSSNTTSAETNYGGGYGVLSFDSDGFTVGNGTAVNQNSQKIVGWNWKAGGSAPAITYTVKVVSDSGNKYRFDDFGTSAVTLDLQEGGTYTFDLSDSSNNGHPMKFSTTSNGSHGGGSTYSTGVVYQLDGASVTESNYVSNFNSASSRKIIITVAASAPTLYYFCHYHSGMGGQANTNSTFGSSNFSGSIQANVSANTTAGFSIVSWTGDENASSNVGHGLGSDLGMIIIKNRIDAEHWEVWHKNLTSTSDYRLLLSGTIAENNNAAFFSEAPTSTVFTPGSNGAINGSGDAMIAYCFAEKKAYSKIGSYTGNNNADGPFVFLGFKPAVVIIKKSSASGSNWRIHDNRRLGYNGGNNELYINTNGTEGPNRLDILSNGIKIITTDTAYNASGETYVYMAFAESPFVNSNGVPTNAR